VEEKERLLERWKDELRSRYLEGVACYQWIKRPDFCWEMLPRDFDGVPVALRQHLINDIKYEGYVAKELMVIERQKRLLERPIPEWLNYDEVLGLKNEARAKLKAVQPRTFGQAARISGINPTDINLIMAAVWKRGEYAKQ
jgi:tRNA uridine 5-carboxymethylaminomethyl modification enzyme